MISVSQLRRLAIQNPQKLEEEAISLRKRLWEMERDYNRLSRRLGKLADAERVLDWIRNGTKQAVFAFTSGPERSICYEIERLWMKPGDTHLDVAPPKLRGNGDVDITPS